MDRSVAIPKLKLLSKRVCDFCKITRCRRKMGSCELQALINDIFGEVRDA